MGHTHVSPVPLDEEGVDGASALAAAVIRRALIDAQSWRQDLREEARAWLADASGEGLGAWCELLDADPSYVRAQVQRALGQG
jgi:hypothetical protein